MIIQQFEFSKDGIEQIRKESKGMNWPVVYLLSKKGATKSSSRLYVGETSNLHMRIKQHLDNVKKRNLDTVYAIFDDEYNKSAILDMEQSLIRLCGTDDSFTMLNGNAGQSASHNYFQRELYQNKLFATNGIWENLIQCGLAKHAYSELVNSDMFKYSPYTTLTEEQEAICFTVLNNLLDGLENAEKTTCVINGSAGTGKTILGIYLMSILSSANKESIDTYKDPADEDKFNFKGQILHRLRNYIQAHGALQIGYILPMTSIRSTIKAVFSANKQMNLSANMVIGPLDVAKLSYDILIVDECHRLYKRKNIVNHQSYIEAAKKLGFDPDHSTTLNWIVSKSKCQVLFYDADQSIKPADITKAELEDAICKCKKYMYKLRTQLRCNGGQAYMEYLQNFFNCSVTQKTTIQNYDIKVFDDPVAMIDEIRRLDTIYGLCRNVAGYSWEWKSKRMTASTNPVFDIAFGAHKYVWNRDSNRWIIRKEAVDEIGCIHTVQGYDLNYVGLIFGREIDYDAATNLITIDSTEFFDINVKKNTTPDELKKYIINAYRVMMSRGIKGCYVYACNNGMQNYLKKFFA